MIIQSDLKESVTAQTWKELHAAQFAFDKPFRLRLEDKKEFVATDVVRLMPKKRMVAFGTWQGKAVVAKLFFDERSAKRHIEKDVAGIKTLQDRCIPTPALLYYGMTEDKRIYVLLFERIMYAENLTDVWQNRANDQEAFYIFKSVIEEIATQHVLGVVQNDLHFKNFLLTDKIIYTLDGGQIEIFPYLLSKKISLHYLALFLSQMGKGAQQLQEDLFRHYAKLRGWVLKPDDISNLFFQINLWDEQRWAKFEKKIFRSSSDFSAIHQWKTFAVYDRQYASPEMLQFLANPESLFDHPSVELLKAGRSATVVKVTFNQKQLVIKRYNMKSMMHRLRRCVRPTRAWVSWRIAQKLQLFGVLTAKPVAFIENRCLGFRGKSYYVTEYIQGGHVGEYLTANSQDEGKVTSMVSKVATMLRNLMKLDITHGDLKITNILLDHRERPVLIDLDGTVEHLSLAGLRRAWRKEIHRFLRNFDADASLKAMFKVELRKK